MAQALAVLISFVFLAVALATGAVLLIVLAAVAAVFILYVLIRQKITGRPLYFTRFTSYTRAETDEENVTPPGVKIIETEYEEIKGDKR